MDERLGGVEGTATLRNISDKAAHLIGALASATSYSRLHAMGLAVLTSNVVIAPGDDMTSLEGSLRRCLNNAAKPSAAEFLEMLSYIDLLLTSLT